MTSVEWKPKNILCGRGPGWVSGTLEEPWTIMNVMAASVATLPGILPINKYKFDLRSFRIFFSFFQSPTAKNAIRTMSGKLKKN